MRREWRERALAEFDKNGWLVIPVYEKADRSDKWARFQIICDRELLLKMLEERDAEAIQTQAWRV